MPKKSLSGTKPHHRAKADRHLAAALRDLKSITSTVSKRCMLNVGDLSRASMNLGIARAHYDEVTGPTAEYRRVSKMLDRKKKAVRKSCGWKR